MPGVWLRVLWRSIKEPEYRRTPLQRLGYVPETSRAQPVVWIHAVSAGETIAVAPLVKRLLSSGCSIVMTNMTPTGRERVGALLGDQVENYYVPYDLPGAVKRFLKNVRPNALVVIDTELWPNMIHHCHRNDIRVLSINARLSEKSARGYRLIHSISSKMLQEIDVVAVQKELQGQRFIELGLDETKLHVAGSIKFHSDKAPDHGKKVDAIVSLLGSRPRLIAASTHPGEEVLVLEAFSKLKESIPGLMLVIAPRHVHRTNDVIRLIDENGLKFVLRSQDKACDEDTDIFLLDTMGELSYFYGACEVAIVGGSFVPIGGHNFMEAVIANVPVVIGPYLRNIEDVAAEFVEEDALVVVSDLEGLILALRDMLQSEPGRQSQISRARTVFRRNEGGLARAEELILEQLADELEC